MLVSKRNQKSALMAELMGDIDAKISSDSARNVAPGDKVHGTVVSVDSHFVFLELTGKMQGLIDVLQFGEDPLPAVGTEMDAYFVEMDEESAKLSLVDANAVVVDASIDSAFHAKLPVEGKYEKEVHGGYEVMIGKERAFCPFSQVAMFRPREGAPSPVGKSDLFLVIEYNPAEHQLVVSHRALEEKEREQRVETLKSSLFEGDIRVGRVTKIMPFGVFVDIGGVEGLIPNQEISWDRSVKAADLMSEGDEVKVKVLKVDWENNRFSFSFRDTQGSDPWIDYCEDFGEGSRVTGKVIKFMPFGAFVQLVPGVDGLIPISRLGNGRHIVDPGEVLEIGQELDLTIESMDPVARKISLSIVNQRIAALQPGEIAVGAELHGIVESVRDFGVFVRLSEEKTGLLHVSETGIPKGGATLLKMQTAFPEGSDIAVFVKGVDGDRISLTLPSTLAARAKADEEEADIRRVLKGNQDAAKASGFGNLGSLFDKVLGTK